LLFLLVSCTRVMAMIDEEVCRLLEGP